MRRKGFTLIEIMLVVTIIGILAAMVVPRLTGRTRQTKSAVAKVDVDVNIPLALDLFELDTGEFPLSLDYLMDNKDGSDVWKGPYLKKVPKDSWGKDYYYKYPGEHNKYTYDLYSAGPDGQPGTNDDVVNWEK
ncbi:MAG: type II secretion system protein GspG [Candidatus Makaraimicrobium thalassicum]|nr:MAG: type II secretion system protein GspG [Candidatus Omnitrophota bacterium]